MGFRTQAQVDRLRLPEGRADMFVFDTECTGLSVRLQGRARTWVCWYAVNGKRRRLTLGSVAGMPLKQARIEAGRIVNGARDGKDALAERAAARARAADTLRALVAIYLERRARPRQRPSTFRETQYNLLRLWAPLHDRTLDSISRRDVAAQLEVIRVNNGPISANRARTHLNAAFGWAMRQGLIERNPVVGTEAPAEERRRDRVLSAAELAVVWTAAGDASEFGTILRLLMLTGQRRAEVAGMAWAELDLERALWTIPGSRTKNRLQHEVPLSRQALALLPERREGRAWVFGQGRKGGYSGFSQAKKRFNLAAGLETPWQVHDLRRSTATHMAEIGIDPHIIEAVLYHVSGHKAGISGVYNLAKYAEQKRAALQSYADWLQTVVESREQSGNVVALRS